MKNNIKKIFVIVMTLMIVASMSITTYAITPRPNIPSSPTIPEISVDVELSDDFWNNYFKENPLPELPEVEDADPEATNPTEVPDMSTDELDENKWHNYSFDWHQLWNSFAKK